MLPELVRLTASQRRTEIKRGVRYITNFGPGLITLHFQSEEEEGHPSVLIPGARLVLTTPSQHDIIATIDEGESEASLVHSHFVAADKPSGFFGKGHVLLLSTTYSYTGGEPEVPVAAFITRPPYTTLRKTPEYRIPTLGVPERLAPSIDKMIWSFRRTDGAVLSRVRLYGGSWLDSDTLSVSGLEQIDGRDINSANWVSRQTATVNHRVVVFAHNNLGAGPGTFEITIYGTLRMDD